MQLSRAESSVPDMLPVLSRGKHRNPRKGACFMELASFLAGERWSDHPSCTHPLLAALARLVNDATSDAARPALGRLIPSVIGLTPADPRVDIAIALRSATVALPVACEERQRVLALGVLSCEEVLAKLEHREGGELSPRSRAALDAVPLAEQWARHFAGRTRPRNAAVNAFRRHAAPTIVRLAIEGISAACMPDAETVLRNLLADAIEDCRGFMRAATPAEATVPVERWARACELTTARRH
jgi:hypothetical protein